MEDRDLMEKELLLIKGVCDLYLHATLEATTAEVHCAFKEALNESINIQNKLYNLMVEKGWYQTRNRNVPHLLESSRTVYGCRFIKLLVNTRDCCYVNDGTPANTFPCSPCPHL